MKAIAALLLGIVSAWDAEYTLNDVHSMDTKSVFEEWANAFNRSYNGLDEESSRYLIWLDNLFKIADYNSQDLTFKLRLNQFGDMTGDEFRKYVHGNDGSCFKNDDIMNSGGQDNIITIDTPPVNAPASVDWTTKGVVTPVKNQGQCGMCCLYEYIRIEFK